MMIESKCTIHGISALVVISVISVGCTYQIDESPALPTLLTGGKLEGESCSLDSDCVSGVCDYIKQDWGRCAPVDCTTGAQAQGIADISFFCNQDGKWQRIKSVGENCDFDYECFRRTGKDCPTCYPEDYRYYCRDICIEEKQLNECEKQGLKRILRQDEYVILDEQCVESLEQRRLSTVCAPCGNGICDEELESECNCPEDCR